MVVQIPKLSLERFSVHHYVPVTISSSKNVVAFAFGSVTTADDDEVLKAFFDARMVFRVPFVEFYTLQNAVTVSGTGTSIIQTIKCRLLGHPEYAKLQLVHY